jgi:SAM-dependent methyltransferase
VREHFAVRAAKYNGSSRWCTDEVLMQRVLDVLALRGDESVLDVACGTGLVARSLRPQSARIVGVDITPEMVNQAGPFLDEMVLADAEALPFDDESFDIAICRQGLQFMGARQAVNEMTRVTRRGGRVCLIHLCAYGPEDREEFFSILRLRNPARRNFFVPEDLVRLLGESGCAAVHLETHVSPEDVDLWSDHGAIDESAREAIRQIYGNASPAFRRLHGLRSEGRAIIDQMLFAIAVGVK